MLSIKPAIPITTMTPAIQILRKAKISFNIHQYHHDPAREAFGLEAAEKLDLPPSQVFKTLVVSLDNNNKNLAVGIIPVDCMLNMKQFAKAAKAKRANMADKDRVQKITGYVLGGVSPLGQRKQLKTLIDNSAETFSTIFVSAGRRGLEIELSPQDLKSLSKGQFVAIADFGE